MEFKSNAVSFEKNLDLWSAPWLALPDYKSLNHHQLAEHVKHYSENYQNDSQTKKSSWQSTGFTEAYLAYFLPLNALRLKAVLQEGLRLNFFAGLSRVVDIGSGCGALPLAAMELQTELYKKINSWVFIEADQQAISVHKKLSAAVQNNYTPSSALPSFSWHTTRPNLKEPENTLTVLSYSLNEIPTEQLQNMNSEALLIVEPSTRACGRRLQELRQKLIGQGYHIWAPCTHQTACPLLIHSQKDWCHHRIHIELPAELKRLHNLLPMKNQTLTYSYLLARKTAPAPVATQARLIGDTLYERGKVRQAICRSSEREFLSWLTKFGEPQPIARGTLLSMDFPFEKKGDELRVAKN